MDDEKKSSILIVDDESANILLLTRILSNDYTVRAAINGKDALNTAIKYLPDIILLDVVMPEMDGYAVITELKGNEATRDIPVIFLTAITDVASEIKGLSYGAVDYIFKPFSRELLLKRVELHLQLKRYSSGLEKMVKEKTQMVCELQNAILETFAEIVERRDKTTGGHIQRTQRYLWLLVDLLIRHDVYREQLSSWDLNLYIMSSQLHNVGKISIRDNILMKPGKLTDEEFNKMKNTLPLVWK